MLSSVGGNHRLLSIRLRCRSSTGTDVLILPATSTTFRAMSPSFRLSPGFRSAMSSGLTPENKAHPDPIGSPVDLRNQRSSLETVAPATEPLFRRGK